MKKQSKRGDYFSSLRYNQTMKYLLFILSLTISSLCNSQNMTFTAMKYGLDSIEQVTNILITDNTVTVETPTGTSIYCKNDVTVTSLFIPTRIKGIYYIKHILTIRPGLYNYRTGNTKRFYRLIECNGPNQ